MALVEQDYPEAERLARSVHALFRELGDARAGAASFRMQSLIANASGNRVRSRALLIRALAEFERLGDRLGIVSVVAHMAGEAAADGRPAQAIRLSAAVDAHWSGGSSPFGTHIAGMEVIGQHLARARAALGEAATAMALAEGRAMTLEQAVAYARAGAGPPPRVSGRPRERSAAHLPPLEEAVGLPLGDAGGPLTPRQREIAVLVAQGLSNRQIAARLVITRGTADRHVANILSKLGFHSRAQIAVWVQEHGLLRPSD